jgi:dipeptidyl aminopeptidase/acylaminoacyl peptidase
MHNPPKVFLDAMKGERHPDAKIVARGLFDHSRPYYEIYSTARKQFAGTIGGELYFRNLKSEEYAQRLKPKNGWFWHIDNAMWSPNGNYLIAKQINDEGVPTIKLTHGSPTDVTYKKYSRAGEKIPSHQFYVIELETLQITAIEQDPEFPYVHLMDWHSNNSNAFFVETDRLMKEMRLFRINTETGEKTVVLKEYSETYLIGLDLLQLNSRRLIDGGLFTLLQDRDQFIWLSERSGFYQLYLYDLEGNLIRSLTNGIFDKIVSIDSNDNWLYYTTHADTTKPYNLQLYKSSLKENNIQKLSDLEGIIDAFVSEGQDSLFVLRSGLPALMQMEAYSMNGDYYETTWKGNLSSIDKSYLNSEYIKVLAADNITEIETLILKPQDFSAKKKYPIVEYIYGGNFSNEVIRDLLDPKLGEMQDLANEGFIVAFIDGRGTPKRGREFRDFSYGKIGQVEIQDHVAALTQIGKDRPYLDMNKIGIIGHSWGGHFALRALLETPDFYKAGHINSAGFDPINFRIAVEAFMGCLPQDCPQSYEQSNISNKLSNLKAPLMIMHGTADDDVPIEESYKLVAKLKEMNYSNYQFIEYQGVNHIIMRHPEWKPTMIDFFVKELQNR